MHINVPHCRARWVAAGKPERFEMGRGRIVNFAAFDRQWEALGRPRMMEIDHAFDVDETSDPRQAAQPTVQAVQPAAASPEDARRLEELASSVRIAELRAKLAEVQAKIKAYEAAGIRVGSSPSPEEPADAFDAGRPHRDYTAMFAQLELATDEAREKNGTAIPGSTDVENLAVALFSEQAERRRDRVEAAQATANAAAERPPYPFQVVQAHARKTLLASAASLSLPSIRPGDVGPQDRLAAIVSGHDAQATATQRKLMEEAAAANRRYAGR